MKTLLVTGSCGLIGSEVTTYFAKLGWRVTGVDNNLRAVFFGPEGDTRWTLSRLRELPFYDHRDLDIRDREGVLALMKDCGRRPDCPRRRAALARPRRRHSVSRF